MVRRTLTILCAVLWLLSTTYAHAFGVRSHQIAAAIAWKYIKPIPKKHIKALFKDAAPCLRKVIKSAKNPRFAFMAAAGYPDIVRHLGRACKAFSHPHWHYLNQYWPTEPRKPQTNRHNVVQMLGVLADKWRNGSADATDVAWIIHLVGDAHQPLHVSSRVSVASPYGDRGGNRFSLRYRANGTNALPCNRVCQKITSLHAYWDKVISFAPYRRGYKNTLRAALALERNYGKSVRTINRKHGKFMLWAQEGLKIARHKIYPARLKQGAWPDQRYQKMAYDTAARLLLLSAYRLADLFNERFK